MFILDTNVLSELRKWTADASVVAWVQEHDEELMFTTVINMYEIRRGILSIPSLDSPQLLAFQQWEQRVLHRFTGRVLPLELDAALQAAEFNKNTNVEFKDCAIAGIAQQHGATVVTRNVRHFADLAPATVDPWHWNDHT